MHQQTPPLDLMNRVQHGDREAIAQLLSISHIHVARELERVVRRWHVTSIDSSDITQDAICSFLERSDYSGFPNRSAIYAYLTRSGLNILIKHIARQRRQKTVAVGLAESRFGPHSLPDNDSSDLLTIVECNLTEREWRLVEMRAYRYKWSRIGDEFGITASAARMRFNRLRMKILRCTRQGES